MRFDSMFGAMEVYNVEYDGGRTARVMDVGGAYQSAVYVGEGFGMSQPVLFDELAFDYHRAYERVLQGLPGARCILMLGGGGYAYPQYVARNHGDVHVDVVEMDAVATAVARRYFGLDDTLMLLESEVQPDRFHLIEGDGRAFLENSLTSFPNSGGYDLVVNDCFSGRAPAMRLATIEAARLIRESLVPGGLYISNIISAVVGPDALFMREIATTLLEVFKFVRVIPCEPDKLEERANNVVIAGDCAEPISLIEGAVEVPGLDEAIILPYQENPSTIG